MLPLMINLTLLGPRYLFCKGQITLPYSVILGLNERVMYNVHLSMPGAAELNKQQFLTLRDSQGQLTVLIRKVVQYLEQ